jgi:hypothetical protein
LFSGPVTAGFHPATPWVNLIAGEEDMPSDKMTVEHGKLPTAGEGNTGEDVKEHYFHLDSTPTHSYIKALYNLGATR